jgi:hypothetical protein
VYGGVVRALLAVSLAVALLGAGVASAAGSVVIGSARFAPNGSGWGTTKPRKLDNGGVPSGIAFHLKWTSWGGNVARGHGKTYGYKPQGGYYRRPVRIKLRAHHLGSCKADGTRAYRRLTARVQKRPGGAFGRPFLWSGQRNLCRPPG